MPEIEGAGGKKLALKRDTEKGKFQIRLKMADGEPVHFTCREEDWIVEYEKHFPPEVKIVEAAPSKETGKVQSRHTA